MVNLYIKSLFMNNQSKILLVDDDPGMIDTLEAILKDKYAVIKSSDGETALKLMDKEDINVAILDIRLPGIDGIEVLKHIKDRHEDIEAIMISAVKDIKIAVSAMKMGAYDYITKDFDYDEVIGLVDKVIEKQNMSRELVYLHSEMEKHLGEDYYAGKSIKMREIYDLVSKVAKLPATVLIGGESGTGKELLARLIHIQGDNPSGPFVTVDLTSIPDNLIESALFGHEKGAFTGADKLRYGKFELANGGTLFLDEIGELKFDLQSKLLRSIQEREIERVGGSKAIHVNVRLIAATNRNLQEAIEKGNFREDLYYRLNVIPIKVPPLKDRKEDIPGFLEYFLKKFNKKFKKEISFITDSAIDILNQYNWPGNIRELANLMERLVAITDSKKISIEDIPIEYHVAGMSRKDFSKKEDILLEKACQTFEKSFIMKTLEKANWSRVNAAKILGIPLSTLKYKMQKLDIYKQLKEEGKSEEEVTQ